MARAVQVPPFGLRTIFFIHIGLIAFSVVVVVALASQAEKIWDISRSSEFGSTFDVQLMVDNFTGNLGSVDDISNRTAVTDTESLLHGKNGALVGFELRKYFAVDIVTGGVKVCDLLSPHCTGMFGSSLLYEKTA